MTDQSSYIEMKKVSSPDKEKIGENSSLKQINISEGKGFIDKLSSTTNSNNIDESTSSPDILLAPTDNEDTLDESRLKNVRYNLNRTKEKDEGKPYIPRWRSSVNEPLDDDDPELSDHENEQRDKVDGDDGEYSNDDLPSFADNESKSLNLEIQRLQRRRDEAEKQTKDHTERVEVMKNHLRQVRQEIDFTNSLVAAKTQEIKSEYHLLSISARTKDHISKEINRITDEVGVDRDRFKELQTEIFRGKKEMDSFRKTMNWNQEDLEEWAKKAAKKEEDNLAIQKYTRADEAKIKELSLVIERLTKTLVEKNSQLNNEMTNTKSRQLEIQRSIDVFKTHHEERQNLVKQWQDTIENMRRRDQEIDKMSVKFSKAKQILGERLEQLAKCKENSERKKAENSAIQQNLDAVERITQLKRQENVTQMEEQESFINEVEILRHENVSSSISLAKTKNELEASEATLEEKKKQLNKVERQFENAKRRLQQEKKEKKSQEDAIKDVEQMLVNHEKELRSSENNVQTLNDQMFKDSQYLAELRKDELTLITDIKSAQKTAKILTSKLQGLSNKRMNQQELIYNADFQKQQMERKIARGLGVHSDEEKLRLQSEIKELEDEAIMQKNKEKELNQQCRKLEHELRVWTRKKEACDSQRKDVQEKICETELEISSCEMSLQKLATERDHAMVAHDVMRLDVRRLRDALKHKVDEVYALEIEKEQLNLSIVERKGEINTYSEVRNAQLRVIEEDKHKNSIELAQRRLVVDKLKSKYEMLCKAYHPDIEGDEEGHSQVYYLIKTAQRKEELQREGDELDHKIRVKEKEMRAMEKTLSHLRDRNTEFRLSFTKADMKSKQAQTVISLEEKIRSVQESLFKKKLELQQLENDFDQNRTQLNQIINQTKQLGIQNNHLIEAKKQVNEELIHRHSVLDTYAQKVRELSVQHRKTLNGSLKNKSLQEQAFCADAMKTNANSILQMLGELSQEFPQICESIKIQTSKVGLVLPKNDLNLFISQRNNTT